MEYHSLSAEQALKELGTSQKLGLTEEEAEARRARYGSNLLVSRRSKSLLVRFLLQFRDFMILILLAAAGLSFFISAAKGEPDYVDAVIILAIVVFNAVLGVVQEAKAERSLEALKQMSAPMAEVLRSGKKQTVPSAELVVGDVIFLETGHLIPADARLLTAVGLKADESALTGESHQVGKEAALVLPKELILGDRRNMVFSGCMVTGGHGEAVVTATGMNTQVGHIARMMLEDESPETPLQKRLAKTGKMLGITALFICLTIFLVGALQGRPLFDMFMTSVSLAVAAIPEGLPAIVTIMLSLGVQRMARKQAVIRHLPAVETLGNATYICSDKTGTLTQNRMTVTELMPIGTERTELLRAFALCNNAREDDRGEPTERALLVAAADAGLKKKELDGRFPRLYELPFDSERKRMTTVHQLPDGSREIIMKGAYDVLLRFCTRMKSTAGTEPLTAEKRRRLSACNQRMTSKALRVIAVASRRVPAGEKLRFSEDTLEGGLTFLGFAGMMDPPRAEVRESVALCKSAGITPVMITGDHALTASAVAVELGILQTSEAGRKLPQGVITGEELNRLSDEARAGRKLPQGVITGEELNRLSDETLSAQIESYRVFARVSPAHKVRIVRALRARGEVVAMTGDGVNDAPALKAADIGCAMGRSGTDVAKNAADMILMDDNFATIVAAVKEGRGIYDNIRKSVQFLLSSNIGEIITIFIAIAFGLEAPLVAVQLLWVNLVTDSLPAVALGMEAPEPQIMKRKPYPAGTGIFTGGMIARIIFEGAMIGLLALIAYILGGRTMAFCVLSLSQLFHAFNMRSERSLFEVGVFSNKRLCMAFVLGAALQIAVVSIPQLALVFQATALSARGWLTVLLLSLAPIPIVELQKRMRNHK